MIKEFQFEIIILKKKISNQEIIFVAHSSFVNKIITLTDNSIASCSEDNNIFIWNTQPPYNKKCSLIGHKSEVTSIIQLKNKKIVSVSGNKEGGIMKIWTMDETNDHIIKQESIINAYCHCSNSLVEIDNNKVAVGGYKIIRIVNIKRKQIEARIEYHNSLISSITVLDNRCIVSASEDGNILLLILYFMII